MPVPSWNLLARATEPAAGRQPLFVIAATAHRALCGGDEELELQDRPQPELRVVMDRDSRAADYERIDASSTQNP